jgi:hypothetical protein
MLGKLVRVLVSLFVVALRVDFPRSASDSYEGSQILWATRHSCRTDRRTCGGEQPGENQSKQVSQETALRTTTSPILDCLVRSIQEEFLVC